MPAPYSYDLRVKAIAAVNRGQRKTNVCKMLGISRNTLDLWLKRKSQTGDFQTKKTIPRKTRLKIKDMKQFKTFVLEHQYKTQQQIAELWGDNLTQQNVSDAMKKLGVTRKKNLWVSRKG